jgi:hypothetical protein
MANAEKTLDVLRRARALVARGWCQGVAGIRESGVPTNAPHKSSEPIDRVCAWGALILTTKNNSEEWQSAEAELERDLEKATEGFRTLVQWNDFASRTRGDVLSLYDRTIARLEGGS